MTTNRQLAFWRRAIAILILVSLTAAPAQAQGNPLPAPNLSLVYGANGATLVNIAPVPVALEGLTLMRAGGVVNYAPSALAASLAPGECVQIRSIASELPLPPTCAKLLRWRQTNQPDLAFWRAGYPNEPFRPQYNGSALTVCNASATACEFYLPQGDEVSVPWLVRDPVTGIPMPAGMQVAFDADQMWIGHDTPGTVLPTRRDIRVIYTRSDGSTALWTPADGPWDAPGWDERGLQPGECLVLYADPGKITPLLECRPVALSRPAEAFWLYRFDVMGPREERRSACGSGDPVIGPVLCLVGG